MIWNPGFEYAESHGACLRDHQLRFWQASEDHRGTPQFPGRVATVVPSPGRAVWGRVFRVLGDRDEVLAYLDHREKFGYERLFFDLRTEEGRLIRALTYVGSRQLTSYIGPEEESRTADVIRRAHGPSGANVDYLTRLYQSLLDLGRMEPHVERLWRMVHNL